MNLNKDVSSWAAVKPEAVMTMGATAIQNVLTMALEDIQRLGRESDKPSEQRVEIASENVAPNESTFAFIKKWVVKGWEPWHIEKDATGWREIYFKRPARK